MAEKKLHLKGKTKQFFLGDREGLLILQFGDESTSFDGEVKSKFKDKSVYKSDISETIFEYLHSYNIPTHFSKKYAANQLQVKKLEMIPIIIVIRNIAAGSLCKRFKVKEGMLLKYPVIEYYLKTDKKEPIFMHESHAYAFDYATPEEMKHISRLALKINAVLKSFFERRNLRLVDYQLEFGRYQSQIYLGDEITPDTSRIWPIDNGDLQMKKRYSFKNGAAEASYKEIHERLVKKRKQT